MKTKYRTMKCIFTRITFTFLSLFILSLLGNAQTKYSFIGATLDSGTALTVGAVYKFTNVKSGVDARVKILNITGGISITNIDGSGGFSEALQPVLTAPPYSNGYVELRITFYQAGTTTLSIQPELPITPIDIDGQMYSGLPLYEFDEIEVINGYTYFQFAGSELTMSQTGTWARGKNNAAVDYPGIDTVQKGVMFTTVNGSLSTMRVRVGVDNRSGTSASRLRSLYFSKFTYPYSYVLEKGADINISGIKKNEFSEINAVITNNKKFDKLFIERSLDGVKFEVITQVELEKDQLNGSRINYIDHALIRSNKYYRIRLVNTDQRTEQLSSIIKLNSKIDELNELKLVNTIVSTSNPVLLINSNVQEETKICIYDMNGSVRYSKQQHLFNGSNAISLSGTSLEKGYFVIVVKTKGKTTNQKIMIQ